jgi:hypothetical protein
VGDVHDYMIVFSFGPLSKNELVMRFDVNGASEFLTGMANASKEESRSVAIPGFELSWEKLSDAKIEFKREDGERLEINGARLTLAMSDEACEYAEFLLKKFIEDGEFSSSEFCGFSRRGRKYNTQVFFVKLSSLELLDFSNGVK